MGRSQALWRVMYASLRFLDRLFPQLELVIDLSVTMQQPYYFVKACTSPALNGCGRDIRCNHGCLNQLGVLGWKQGGLGSNDFLYQSTNIYFRQFCSETAKTETISDPFRYLQAEKKTYFRLRQSYIYSWLGTSQPRV